MNRNAWDYLGHETLGAFRYAIRRMRGGWKSAPSGSSGSNDRVAERSRRFGAGPRSGNETLGAFRYAIRRWALLAGAGILLVGGLASCRKAAPAASAAAAFDPRLGSPLTVRQRPTLGSDQAPVVVIEVSSFQCPHCLEFRNDTFPALRKEFIDTGKVQWVMVNAAPDAATAREPVFAIAKCLDRQGAYGGLFDLLFNNGDLPAPQLRRVLSAHGGYSETKLNTCLSDPSVQREIAADFSDYQRLEVTGTPTFFVRKLRSSGKRSQARIVGNLPLGYFERTLNQMLRLP